MDSNWLSHISIHHKEWVSIIRSWGEHDYAEDLVQEMYIRCLSYSSEEKIIQDGKVNKGYIWFVLRSVFIMYKKECSKVEKLRIDSNFDIEAKEDIELEYAYGQLLAKVDKSKSNWHWYDVKLFDLYMNSGMSMRKIEAQTNISLTSIHHTIKNCKARLTKEVGEDIQDYFNNDYELL